MTAITLTDLENAALDVATIGSIANSTSPTVTDRLGQSRPTMTGLAAEYPAASANAAAALVSKNAAGVSETNALASKVAAESARDAAIIGAGVYTTEALGRAAVADGVAFKVQGSGDIAAYEYRRTNSGASVLIATYPSKAAVDLIRTDFPRVGRNKFANPTFAKSALGALGLGVAPSNYSGVDKSGVAGVSYPNAAIVEKANKLLRTNKALELSHASTGTTGTDYQPWQIFDIPPELWGDTTVVGRIVCAVQHEVAGISIDATVDLLNAAGAYQTTVAGTKVSTDGAPGTWFYAVFDFAISNADTRKLKVKARSRVIIGPTLTGKAWLGGIFFDFSRPEQVTFDRNLPEEIADAATVATAAVIGPLQSDIVALKASEAQSAAWRIGTNVFVNPLMTADAIGLSGNPTSYVVTGAGSGSTPVVTKGIAAVATPFFTDRAFSATHFFDGTLHTDIQVYQELPIPEIHWGDTSLKARFIYYVKNSDTRINSSAYLAMLNSGGGILSAPAMTKVSTDGAANTWYPVIHDITVTDPLARKVRFSTRQNASRLAGNFSGATSLTTAFFAGFNRSLQTAFDRNASYEADQLAKSRVDALRAEFAGVTQRTVVGAFDRYTDARGNILPVLPTAVIECFGDSLTAANYASKVAALYLAAGSTRTIKNCGIGSETSIQILDRIKGHSANTAGITWAPGTIRLKTKRAVPPRTIDETYRASWSTFGITLAEPSKVEFFNTAGLIGSTRLQLKATASVSGIVLSATAHPFLNGDEVYHLGSGLPSGMYAGKVYYVRDVSANAYSLAEFSAGAAVSFGAGTATSLGPFYLDWAYTSQNTTITTITHTDKSMATAVLWMGANNPASTQQVKDDITAAFNHFKTLAKRVLVMTVLPEASSLPATAAGISLKNINAWILSEFPDNSVDALGYLQSKYNPAIPQDVTDVANNLTPTSLRSDTIHLTDAGYQHIADLVYAAMTSKGW